MKRLISARRYSRSYVLLSLFLLPAACGGGDEPSGAAPQEGRIGEALVSIPGQGAPDTLDIGEWNVDWFGSTGNGPTDEALQLSNVHDVLLGADLDIWGLEEVASAAQFAQLVGSLPGYAGLLANDPSVTNGSAFYSAGEQKVAIVYKTSIAKVNGAKLVVTDQAANFGGRPPMEVSLTVSINGATLPLTLIVLHAKAFSDTTSYNERLAASGALKTYLDGAHPSDRVVVVGDFNDDVDGSITTGKTSPYQNFVSDTARYFFPTKALSDAGLRSTVSNTHVIDHHLITNEVVPLYVPASAKIFLVDQFISNYEATTSDHYPTLAHYTVGASPANVFVNEILANEPGSDTGGEFVEIVNAGGAADLSGWTISDSVSVRHTFASGTSLSAGGGLVVFGSASSIPAGTPGASGSSTGSLSLNNGGDTVTLKDAAGNVVSTFAYPASLASTDAVSMNRSPDAVATGTFVLHTALVSALASPGKHADGSAFAP